jgi:hypothetical protein
MGSKHFLQSKTIQGNILNLVSVGVLFFTAHNPHDKTLFLSGLITAIISTGYSIYGRFVAKERLHIKKKKDK